jgi:hypothetical protein
VPKSPNDEVVRQIRESRKKRIQEFSAHRPGPDARRIYQVQSEWELIEGGVALLYGAEGSVRSILSPTGFESVVPFEGVFRRAA